MRFSKLGVLVAATAATALVLSACGGSSGSNAGATSGSSGNGSGSNNGAVVKDGSFSWVVSDDPGALNPASASRTVAVNLYRFLYDPLVHSDPTGKIVSGLAESWKVDGATATFKIKSGITCSDGSPVTAATVAKEFNLIKDPKTASSLIGNVVPNGNFTATADDATSTFTLKLAAPYLFVLPAMEFVPIPCGSADPTKLTTTASGSGPFTLTEAVTGDHYTLTRREGYTWGPDGATTATEGLPKTLTMKIVSSESTAANLLSTGQLNAAAINGPDRTRLTSAGLTAKQSVSGGNLMLFNEQEGKITADPNVRKAIVEALNFDQLAAVITQGLSSKASTSLAPAEPQYCPDSDAGSAVPKQNVEDAKKLLAAAGWTAGSDGVLAKGGKQLVLKAPYLSTYAGNQPAAELEAQMLQAVGIKLTLAPITQANLSTTIFSTGDYDIWPGLALSLTNQSGTFGLLGGPVPPKGINAGHVSSAQFTQLATQANTSAARDTGCKTWIAAQKALFSNADAEPVAPVFTNWITAHASFNTMQGRIIPTSIRVTN